MVDVSGKLPTDRRAVAEGRVSFPSEVATALREQGFSTAKGPVFHTAIVAGVQAVKRTHELIPFCHPLPIEGCTIDVEMAEDEALITCSVSAHHKTGVEMEALTGVFAAALTIYDMCKAMTPMLLIGNVRLVEKTGGKHAWFDLSRDGRKSP